MKKLYHIISLLLASLTFIFASCSIIPATQHTHEFTVQAKNVQYLKSEATCLAPQTYYYSCSCGEKGEETFTFSTKGTHEYTNKTVDVKYLKAPATCSTPTVYYKSCKWCGQKGTEIYTFTVEETVEHDFSQEIVSDIYLKSEATKEMCAIYYKSCICGEKGEETFEYGEVLKDYKPIDVYLIAGQSNAAGYSFHDNLLTETFGNVWYAGETDKFRDGSFTRSSNLSSFSDYCFELKAGYGTDSARIGPEYGMAKVLNSYYTKESPAMIFKSAAGGTSLQNVSGGESGTYGNWYPRSMWASGFTPNSNSATGLQYYNFIENFKKVFYELKANGYLAKVKGMVWMQGCSDLTCEDVYENLIRVFIQNIRIDLQEITQDTSLAQMPFVIGKIATTVSKYNNPYVPAFNAMQQLVADTMQNVYTVETADLIIVKEDGTYSGRDQYHFAAADMVTLGMRFADKLKPSK